MKKVFYFLAGAFLMLSFTVYASNPPTFTDSATFDNWFAYSVDSLMDKGVIKGYPDGSFKPNNIPNRAELAVTLERLDSKIFKDIQNITDGKIERMLIAEQKFADIEMDETYRAFIIMAEAGLKIIIDPYSSELENLTLRSDAKLPAGFEVYNKDTDPNRLYIKSVGYGWAGPFYLTD